MKEIKVGESWRGKKIRELKQLSNGWYVIKTDNSKSQQDFKVKTIFSLKSSRSMTPKHAHFVIGLYGKVCTDKEKGKLVFRAIIDVWSRNKTEEVLKRIQPQVVNLPGYPLEYILTALAWILNQEDINFTSRPDKKQRELDDICQKQNVTIPQDRKGSQLAIALLCEIVNGVHPVDALLKANLDVQPRRKM